MIILTGASGMIGRNLKDMYPDLLSPSHKELDLTDKKQVKYYIEHNKPTKIIHCASNDDEVCLYDNLRMFVNLAELYIPMIIFSTGRNIEDRIDKTGEYILSKYISQDLSINKYNHIKVIKIWGCFGQYEKESRFLMNNMIRIKKDLPILIKENKYFSYVYVKDLIKIIMMTNTVKSNLIKICPYTKTLLEYAQILKEVTNSKKDIIIEKDNFYQSYVGKNNFDYEYTPIKTAITEMWENIKYNHKIAEMYNDIDFNSSP